MDLFVCQNDVPEMHKELRKQYESGTSTLFAYKGGSLEKGKLEYGEGYFDISHFTHHHPYDSDLFEFVRIRPLYEMMVLIRQNRIRRDELLVETIQDSINIINIGRMMERREKAKEELEKPYLSARNESNLNLSKSGVMTEQELRFTENQFKKIGIAEAFTPELVAKMKHGDKLIEHQHTKIYDGDEARATFHLKRGDTSNLYFLNNFDLTLRKDGQTNEVSRLFYLNNFKRSDDESKFQNAYYTSFTFKEAFNYLSGRPVLKTFENQKQERYQSWELRNSKTGEEKHYHENYGFNLEKVLRNYSMKELTNKEYTDRLIQSLQRGNFQSVTFVGRDGKIEKLFISPDIPLGALKVFDADKTRVPTQQLVDKGYIGKELAEKIHYRIKLNMQNGKHSEKHLNQSESISKQSDTVKKETGLSKEAKSPGQSVKGEKQSHKHKSGDLDENGASNKQNKKQRQKLH